MNFLRKNWPQLVMIVLIFITFFLVEIKVLTDKKDDPTQDKKGLESSDLIQIFETPETNVNFNPNNFNEFDSEKTASKLSLIDKNLPIFNNSINSLFEEEIDRVLNFSVSPDESHLFATLYDSAEERSDSIYYNYIINLGTGEIVLPPTNRDLSEESSNWRWIGGSNRIFEDSDIKIKNVKGGVIKGFRPVEYPESEDFFFVRLNLSPDQKRVLSSYSYRNQNANDILEVLNLETGELQQYSVDTGWAQTWFSHSSGVLGCKDGDFYVLDLTTAEEKKITIEIPAGKYYSEFVNCSLSMKWVTPDKVAFGEFLGDAGAEGEIFIVNFESLEVFPVISSSWALAYPEFNLMVAVGNRDWSYYSSVSVPHITVYDADGKILHQKIFEDQPKEIAISRRDLDVIDSSKIFYRRNTANRGGEFPTSDISELVVLDFETNQETVVATVDDSRGNLSGFEYVKLLSDKKTWIAISYAGNFHIGEINL